MVIWGIARALHRCRTEIIETPGPPAAKRDEERRIAAASLAHPNLGAQVPRQREQHSAFHDDCIQS